MYLTTYMGNQIDPMSPDPQDICITDISHALSNMCRFSGNTTEFYSVAEHSLRVASLVPREYKLEALLHDATEAYLGDVPTPIKKCCGSYLQLESKFHSIIAMRFGIPKILSEVVKEADREMLLVEAKELVPFLDLPAPTKVPVTRRTKHSQAKIARSFRNYFTMYGGVA